jgi:hypothetical protein
VNSVLNLQVPQNAGKLLCGFTTGALLSSAKLHIVSYEGNRGPKIEAKLETP